MFAIESAQPGDQEEIAQLYADVFLDDPVWTAIVPEKSARRKVIAGAFRAELKGEGVRHVDVARDETGRIVGALNYQTPDGSSHETTPIQRLIGRIAGFTVPWMRRSERHESVMAGFHPAGPHWYLKDLVTSPSVRGKGLGSSLLEHRLKHADRDAIPTFLESTTPASRRLYERYGFELVGVVSELPGTNSFAMIRQPRTN